VLRGKTFGYQLPEVNPTRPTLSKGDVVIMDNVSAHKSPKAEQLIHVFLSGGRVVKRECPQQVRA
jgi:hypothetical protein